MITPVMVRLFFSLIIVALLTVGTVVTIRKRHEGVAGIRAGAFLMATALILGVSLNGMFVRTTNKDTHETGTVMDWYEAQNKKARTQIARWVFDLIVE